jgi:hypothetical protein
MPWLGLRLTRARRGRWVAVACLLDVVLRLRGCSAYVEAEDRPARDVCARRRLVRDDVSVAIEIVDLDALGRGTKAGAAGSFDGRCRCEAGVVLDGDLPAPRATAGVGGCALLG